MAIQRIPGLVFLTYKPAKIQINFLGFPGTMGADSIDYIIADKCSIPEQFNNFYSEKIIRLPHSYMPTDNTREISNRPITRKKWAYRQKVLVFVASIIVIKFL